MRSDPTDINSSLLASPLRPHVMVLFGATGDLARRKLLPGPVPPRAGRPPARVPHRRHVARRPRRRRLPRRSRAPRSTSSRTTACPTTTGTTSPARLFYVVPVGGQRSAGEDRRRARRRARRRRRAPALPERSARRPRPRWCSSSARSGSPSGPASSWRSRSAPTSRARCELNDALHATFDESQIFRIDHFLGKEAALNILAFRFANGLFEPIWNRQHIAHVQIDVPETLSIGHRIGFYEKTGAYRDMVVNHLFQVLAFMAMEPPTALEPRSIGEEKNKVFRSLSPIEPSQVVRGQYDGYLDEPGVRPHSETETFIALRCEIDNWRWAGVPFYLRTGKRMAEGARIISIAFREPPKSMFPSDSGVGAHGPDHLTFDLADASQPLAVVLRQAARPGHAARQAEPAVLAARDRAAPPTCSRRTSA